MKKILAFILTSIFVITSFVLCGCDTRSPAYKKILAKDETDGQFYYYYMESLNGYAIVGDMEENNPEVMYLPAYYKGKEVKQVFFNTVTAAFGMATKNFGPSFKNVKQIYIPFTHPSDGYATGRSKCGIQAVYYPGTTLTESDGLRDGSMDFWLFFISNNTYEFVTTFYFHDSFYDIVLQDYIADHTRSQGFIYENRSDRTFFTQDHRRYYFAKANISFYFNYKGSSNKDVFFVDNSNYGATIKDTPYYPLREGYEFTGWYKESECINKWDFEKDTLPIVEYDKEGNATEYIETKLYAGWQKI